MADLPDPDYLEKILALEALAADSVAELDHVQKIEDEQERRIAAERVWRRIKERRRGLMHPDEG